MTTSTSAAALISSVEELKSFSCPIDSSHKLYVDVVKNDSNRRGAISLLTILVHPQNIVRVIDVLALGKLAFTTKLHDGKSLASILGDTNIPKYIWDVRHAADALQAHSGVSISGVLDIQLLELASRTGDKTHVIEPAKAIRSDLRSDTVAIHRWTFSETVVRKLMDTNIFAERPLDVTIVEYCVNNMVHLPELHAAYLERINPIWLCKAETESRRRLDRVRSPENDPHAHDKTLGPWAPCRRTILSLDELLEKWEDDRVEALAADLFGDDFGIEGDFHDDGYYDDGYYDDGYDDDDNWPTSCRDIINDCDMHLYYSD